MGLLVLSRKVNEAIIIGEGANKVVIRIVDMNSDRVRVGIDAPREIAVHREEIWEKIHGEDKDD